jgi:outer membrane protein OmpA-like peptidoglycan-associated protein
LFGYLPYEEQLDNSKCITVDDEMYYVILLIPLKKGDKLVLPNVFFHPNSTVLKQNSFVELNKLVDYLNTNPVKISINGHTQGNNKINNTVNAIPMEYQFKGSASKLSKKRAEVVFNYLVQKGIASERLTVKGYAGRNPIIKHPKNRKEREINMRVEIKIVDINTTYLK